VGPAAICDGSFNGYGLRVSATEVTIERRDGGTGTVISDTVPWNRPHNSWYRYVFMANPDNTFSLLLYNKNGRQLASLKSNADTTYNSFNRVAVHGGYDFYVDDMKVVRPKDYNPGAVWAGTGRNYALVYHPG